MDGRDGLGIARPFNRTRNLFAIEVLWGEANFCPGPVSLPSCRRKKNHKENFKRKTFWGVLAGERNVSLGVSLSLVLSFSWKWFGKTCLSSSARNTFPPCLPWLTASVSVPEHGAGSAGEDGRAREDHRLGQEEAGAHAKVQPAARARGALINMTKTCLFGAAFLGHSRTKSILERLNPLARSEVAAKDSPVSDSEQEKKFWLVCQMQTGLCLDSFYL